MTRRFVLAFVLATAAAAAARADGVRTVEIGGRKVDLLIADDVLLVQPKDAKLTRPGGPGWEGKAKEYLAGVVNEQAKFTKDKKAPIALATVQSAAPRVVPQVEGFVAPRAKNLSASGVGKLSSAPNVKSATTLYRVDGGLLFAKPSVSIRFKAAPPAATITDLSTKYKMKERTPRPAYLPDVVQFDLQPGAELDAFEVAEKSRKYLKETIHWAEPDLVHEVKKLADPAPPPNDKYLDKQWYLKTIAAPAMWAKAQPAADVLVAVVDDGVDGAHPDLKDQLIHGKNFVRPGEGQPADPEGWGPQGSEDNHGTPCAGLIAARHNNAAGICGIGRGVKVIPVRIDGFGFADEDDMAAGFTYAREKGAKVISCSLRFTGPTAKIRDAITAAASGADGCVVVAAAGNDGRANVVFPAAHPDVIGVGATDQDDKLWDYSNRGPERQVTLVAPSGLTNYIGIQGVWSTDRTDKYGLNEKNHVNGLLSGEDLIAEPKLELVGDDGGDYTGRFGGTSAAAPMVAAVAGTIRACYPALTPKQVREALIAGADKVQPDSEAAEWGKDGYSVRYGYGRLNAERALAAAATLAAKGKVPAPAPPPPALTPARAQPPKADTLPKSEKETAAAKTIFAIASKAAVPWVTDGVEVRVEPCPTYVVVLTPTGEDGLKALKAVVSGDKNTDDFVKKIYEDKAGTFALYRVARVGLKVPAELTALGKEEFLPIVYPCYQSAKGEVIFRGTLTVDLGATERTAEDVKKAAKELGLKEVPADAPGQKTAQFLLTNGGAVRSPNEAVNALRAKLKIPLKDVTSVKADVQTMARKP